MKKKVSAKASSAQKAVKKAPAKKAAPAKASVKMTASQSTAKKAASKSPDRSGEKAGGKSSGTGQKLTASLKKLFLGAAAEKKSVPPAKAAGGKKNSASPSKEVASAPKGHAGQKGPKTGAGNVAGGAKAVAKDAVSSRKPTSPQPSLAKQAQPANLMTTKTAPLKTSTAKTPTTKSSRSANGLTSKASARAIDVDAICREVACESLSTTGGYCRLHYIKNWKKIKRKEVILKERKLNQYIEELVSKYPDKYIEAIRQDLLSEKDFSKVLADLDIDENSDEFEGDAEGGDAAVETVRRGDFDDDSDMF